MKLEAMHNGVMINGKQMDNRIQYKIEYSVLNREDFIQELLDYLYEYKKPKVDEIRKDLRYLLSIKDNSVFCNFGGERPRQIIARSDNKDKFDAICRLILMFDKQFEDRKNANKRPKSHIKKNSEE